MALKRASIIAVSSAAFALVAYAAPTHAWGRSGHRDVCLTAWEQMTEPTRSAVLDLLEIKTSDEFAAACYWADEVRPKRPETGPWHYINIPKDARSIDLDRDCPLPASCVVREIDRKAAILKSPAPKVERAEALKFLSHFVGDLHQPLHVGFREDLGGNKIEVIFLGKKTNMHALWDWGLLETPMSALENLEPHVTITSRLNRPHWRGGTVQDWAQETLWRMRSPAMGYLGNPGGLEFGEAYVNQNYPIAKEQVEKAGVRLGDLLNQILAQ